MLDRLLARGAQARRQLLLQLRDPEPLFIGAQGRIGLDRQPPGGEVVVAVLVAEQAVQFRLAEVLPPGGLHQLQPMRQIRGGGGRLAGQRALVADVTVEQTHGLSQRPIFQRPLQLPCSSVRMAARSRSPAWPDNSQTAGATAGRPPACRPLRRRRRPDGCRSATGETAARGLPGSGGFGVGAVRPGPPGQPGGASRRQRQAEAAHLTAPRSSAGWPAGDTGKPD
ncbi:Uncharacterised protein [Chromobacterium violaceum]|uniref:Uncharacterized protein n=1 Tax=Chromobacterium violaceum TaxID=536 RepID=A0A447TF54_CHRVL|nr:Uncharacterised protein [Chromobacterium violaceum]